MKFEINICKSCFDLEVGMCNDPECVFIRKTQKEVSDLLDILLIRPIVDGVQLSMTEGQQEMIK
jgi:hypothetical protein